MKKSLLHVSSLLFIVFSLICAAANAQSLRWGASGGSSDGSAGGPDETVVDMATDPAGNIYVLSNVFHTSLYVAGHSKSAYGSRDIMLSSFKCDGTYRWSKLFGGSSDDVADAVKTDSLGGVYITGYLASHFITLHLDSDTSWATGSSYKTLFLAKYDTAGNYKWLNMPESDTVGITAASNNTAIDMDVDGSGNIYLMTGLLPGSYAGGSFVVTSKGVYILKYSNNGFFQSNTKMQIGYTRIGPQGLSLKRDFTLNRYYVTGNGVGITSLVQNLTFNGTAMTKPLFIGAFDNSGTFLWKRENTSGYGTWFGRAAIDNQHNIYIAGTSQALSIPDTFNSYVVHNSVTIHGTAPLIVKLDTNGTNIWASNASSNHAVYSSNITLNGSSITIAGNYNGKLVCSGLDSLYHPTAVGEGYDIFLLNLNAGTGSFLKLDSITSSFPDNEFATGITADKHGNVYVGGNFGGSLFANTDSMSNIGGGSDFFVTKYGYDNCNCTASPISNFTHSGTTTINFTYTGTATGLDSVVWTFGDGSIGRGNTASHTYAASGTYYACAATYTACGSNTHCDSVSITTGIDKVGAFANISIYPNPMSNALVIQHAAPGTQLTLFNMMSARVYSSTITNTTQQINTTQLSPGTYLLQLRTNNGDKMNMTLVK